MVMDSCSEDLLIMAGTMGIINIGLLTMVGMVALVLTMVVLVLGITMVAQDLIATDTLVMVIKVDIVMVITMDISDNNFFLSSK